MGRVELLSLLSAAEHHVCKAAEARECGVDVGLGNDGEANLAKVESTRAVFYGKIIASCDADAHGGWVRICEINPAADRIFSVAA